MAPHEIHHSGIVGCRGVCGGPPPSPGGTPRRTLTAVLPEQIIGSTSWAEAQASRTLANAAVYLNVDSAASGANFFASASPSCSAALVEAVRDAGVTGWSGSVGALGGGSDYAPFINHLGIASVDFGFGSDGSFPVYHSVCVPSLLSLRWPAQPAQGALPNSYDSFTWMEKFGDPTFQSHTLAATIWGLLAMRFSTQVRAPSTAGVPAPPDAPSP